VSCEGVTSNKVLPAGSIYIGPADGSEEYLFAEVDSLGTTIKTEFFEEYGGSGDLLQLQMRAPTKVTRTGSLTGKSIVPRDLARYFIGAASSITTTATPVVDESIQAGAALIGGAWYQLGETSGRPSGVRNVGSVAIAYGAVPTTATLNTDYILDATLARFQVVEGGDLDGAEDVVVDYTPTASTWEHIATSADLAPANVRLRWIARNLGGSVNRDLFCPCVSMVPTGDLIWASAERNKVQALGFDLAFLGQIYIDGRPVAA
jgi:hypothetical protein